MNNISEEAMRRFKRVEPNDILDDAKVRLSQIPEETLQTWRGNFHSRTNGYMNLDDINEILWEAALQFGRYLEKHQEYLTSHQDNEFTEQEVLTHNKYSDEHSLYIVFYFDEISRFPSLPILPPTKPLVKISGVIEEVTFTKAMACFEATAYSTVQEELERKRQQDNIGAALAMIAQSMTDSPAHALINDGKPEKLKCLHVKGKINGKQFSGWFGMTNIRPGDYVEMAVMPDDNNYLTYAIANPEQRTISMTPKCHTGGGDSSLTRWIINSHLFLSIIFIPIAFFLTDFSSLSFFIYIVVSLIFGITCYRRTMKEEGVQFQLFENIANTLNFSNPKFTSLGSITTTKIKKMKESGKYKKRGSDNKTMPQTGYESLYEYFYYY